VVPLVTLSAVAESLQVEGCKLQVGVLKVRSGQIE
jgi:hypothetical protein